MPNAGGWGHFLSKPGIVEDTWIKMREVTLSYTLPAKVIKKLKAFSTVLPPANLPINRRFSRWSQKKPVLCPSAKSTS